MLACGKPPVAESERPDKTIFSRFDRGSAGADSLF